MHYSGGKKKSNSIKCVSIKEICSEKKNLLLALCCVLQLASEVYVLAVKNKKIL